MKTQKKQPELRFEGFTDDWEQVKLGDIVLITMGQSPNSENYTENPNDYILVQGNADMKNGKVIPRVWTTQVTKIADKNDLILSVRAPVGDIGKTDYNIVLGRGVAAIKGNEFIFQTLIRMKKNGFWTKLSTGSTFESINSSDIKEACILIPKKEEQKKIGEFFQKLDKAITLQQRKLEIFEKLKQGYLQQMFPTEKMYTPRLRFSGFKSDWEQSKLGDELELLKDGTHGTHQDVDEGIYLLSAKNIKNGKINIDDLTERKISIDEYDSIHKNFSLQKNDVLLTIVGSIGESAIIKKPDGMTFQRSVAYFRPKKRLKSQFLFTTIIGLSFQEELKRRQVISAQPGIYLGDLALIPFLIPDVEEQIKIGNFFKQLDDIIALQQSKIEHQQQLKQAYLQKLFP